MYFVIKPTIYTCTYSVLIQYLLLGIALLVEHRDVISKCTAIPIQLFPVLISAK